MVEYKEMEDIAYAEQKHYSTSVAHESPKSVALKSVALDCNGRITIFSLNDCPHCKRTKTLFRDLGWEYYEISLTDYPDAKAAMLRLSNRLTVPQVWAYTCKILFINHFCMGNQNDRKSAGKCMDSYSC